MGIGTPTGAFVNPSAQDINLAGAERREFGRWRHEDFGIQPGDIADEFALVAVAGNDVIRVVAAPSKGVDAIIEAEITFWFCRAVAAKADVLENRAHIALKNDRARSQIRNRADRRIGFRRGKMGSAQQYENHRDDCSET